MRSQGLWTPAARPVAPPGARSARRRALYGGLIAAVALIHLGLFAWLALMPVRAPPLVITLNGLVDGRSLGLPTGVRPPTPSRRPPAPPSIAPVSPPPLPNAPSAASSKAAAPSDAPVATADVAAEPDEIDAKAAEALAERLAAAGSVGAPRADPECGIVQRVARDLEQDAGTRAALERLPRASLSVSGAILVWNGAWIDPALIGGPGVSDAIRAGVARGLANASADCLQREISGPRFIVLDGRRGQAILVIGSGAWRWSDLLPSPGGGTGGAPFAPQPKL